MGPYFNGAGAVVAMVVTIANMARTILEESVWMIIFMGIVHAALRPS